jgi:hypothetical protein
MFPKSVSVTSGKRRENKGNDININYDENPADNDPHGECRSEIHQLQDLLGRVYDQCGNHRAADQRHCLPPSLRDEIQKYLKARGHQCAITSQENKGNDMVNTGDPHEANAKHFKDLIHNLVLNNGMEFTKNSSYGKSVIWASERIAELEQSVIWGSERIAELEAEFSVPEKSGDEIRDMFFGLGYGCELTAMNYGEAVLWGQNRIRHLERVLRDEQEVVGEIKKLKLENERLSLGNENLSKTILALSNPPLLDSPQTDEEIHQQRRRERMLDKMTLFCVTFGFDSDDGTLKEWGHTSRGMAVEIIRGINEYDAKH